MDTFSTSQHLYWDGLSRQQRQRIERYKLLWDMYEGDHKKPLKKKRGMPDDNVIINHSRRVVDKGVSFLFGKTLTWELTEGDTTPEEEALSVIWGSDEHRMSLLHDVALNGGVTGIFYIQIVPQGDDIESVQPDQIRLVNLDPQIVFPVWNPRDVDDVWAYELRFRNGDTVERTIYSLESDDEGNRVEGSWVFWSERLQKSNEWVVTRDKQMWPWEWPPIIHGKNLPRPNHFFGYSDLEDADLNDAINFIAGNTNKILRLFAHPIGYGFGVAGQELDIEPGKFVGLKNPDAFLKYLEMSSELGGSDQYLGRLTDAFYQTTRVPAMDPETMQLGVQSGFALRVLHGDLLEKTETKRRLYGMPIIEVNRRLADILNFDVEDSTVTLHWQDPLPEDKRERTESDKFDLENAIASLETLRRMRGYDHETEMERLATERAARDLAEKSQAILTLTNAGASLEAAAETVGLSEELVRNLIQVSANGQVMQ